MIEYIIIAAAAGFFVGMAVDHWISSRNPTDWGEPKRDEHKDFMADLPDFLKRQAD